MMIIPIDVDKYINPENVSAVDLENGKSLHGDPIVRWRFYFQDFYLTSKDFQNREDARVWLKNFCFALMNHKQTKGD